MLVKDITSILEKAAPLALQESYDNAGLFSGSFQQEVTGILLTIDITEDVIEEAILKKANLIISHHPLVMQGIKKITEAHYTGRCIIKAIQNNIAIYCAHTNMDNASEGVNAVLANKLGLTETSVLAPATGQVCKLVTFVPTDHAEKVRNALFDAGAGHIGNYDCCSFNAPGEGTFRAGEGTNPFVGEKGKVHGEAEIRIETIFPRYRKEAIIRALIESHPYEEAAYDILLLENPHAKIGSGRLGFLKEPMAEKDFLKQIKDVLGVQYLRHTPFSGKKIHKVAVCGGSGGFLIPDAIASKADAFITADLKYHQFFEAPGNLLLIDAGHYETEQFTKNIFYNLFSEKFPTFAVHFSEVKTNPINFF